mgnify:FL=1
MKINDIIKKYILHQKKQYTYYILVNIIICIISIFIPYAIGLFIDKLKSYQHFYDVIIGILILLLLYIIKEVLSYVVNMLYIIIQAKSGYSYNKDTIEHLKHVSLLWIENNNISYLNQRINNDANEIVIFCLSTITGFVINIITMLVSIALIFKINICVFIIVSILLAIECVGYIIFKGKIFEYSYELKEESSTFFSVLQEQLDKAAFIKCHSVNKLFVNKLDEAFKQLFSASYKKVKITMLFEKLENIMLLMGQCIVLAVCGYEVMNDFMTIGTLYLVYTYFSMLIDSGKEIITFVNEKLDMNVSLERMQELENIDEENDGSHILENISEINCNDISFSYPDKVVFKKLNCYLKGGNIYGIIGENGIGKSTLLKIILGIYPVEGYISLNGLKQNSISMKNARKNLIGITEQEPILMSDSLKYNIFLDNDINTNITKFEVLMDGFGLGKYVSDIKSGKDVTINDSNSNLSGGEKQKIAIIRQLIQCPDVMLFDEPTSALDKESRVFFLEYLKKIKKDHIIVIVSHDNNLISQCDNIIDLSM